jgi:hypothetical protein
LFCKIKNAGSEPAREVIWSRVKSTLARPDCKQAGQRIKNVIAGKMNTVTSPIIRPLLELNVIYWFVHPAKVPPTTLGFLRDNEGRAFIIGGLTGSHWGGHADTWWSQFQKVVWEGYIPVERAVAQLLIPPDWMPPSLEGQDARFVNIILSQHEVEH